MNGQAGAAIPNKITERLTKGIKKFQPILQSLKSRDNGEADTVLVVTDMLSEIFGYDRYAEITAEYAIRGTYCDLAIKLDGSVRVLIEVKAIGLELKDAHLKQAVDYAVKEGVDWVILTNGLIWRVYKVAFTKPIDQELVVDVDFAILNPKRLPDLELLYLCCKEAWARSVLGDYHTQKQTLSRFYLGAVITSEAVLEVIRRELRRLAPEVKFTVEDVRNVICAEVLKREVLEGPKADEARKKIGRAANKAIRTPRSTKGNEAMESEAHALAITATVGEPVE